LNRPVLIDVAALAWGGVSTHAERDDLVCPDVVADPRVAFAGLVVTDFHATDHQHAVALRQSLSQVDQSAHGSHPKPLRTLGAFPGRGVGARLIDGHSHGRDGSSLLGRTYGWVSAEIANESQVHHWSRPFFGSDTRAVVEGGAEEFAQLALDAQSDLGRVVLRFQAEAGLPTVDTRDIGDVADGFDLIHAADFGEQSPSGVQKSQR